MKKSGIFLLAAVLSLPVWAGKLDDDCRKVRVWINENPNQVSRRLYIRDLNKIMNSAQSEAQKIEALQKKFPEAFLSAWQKDLDAAKAQGVKFSDDNKTLIKCPESVTLVIIPSCVTTIGDRAFDRCKNLTSVEIPDSVTTIGDYAFALCENLRSVTIPDSVTTIGDRAFIDVKSVKVADDNPVFMVDDAGALIDIENGRILYFPQSYQGSYVIPDGVTTIGETAFSSCHNLTSVTIPASVTTIGDCAFLWCKNLTSVTIPDSVTTIGEGAFLLCTNLTSVTIPDSVTKIGEQAFDGCRNLTSVEIPDSVTTIGKGAFSGCDNLRSVTIGNSVTTIGEEAFAWCENLTSVTIPANAKYTKSGIWASFPVNCTVIRRK